MKTCFKCGDTKPISEFYQHSEMRDGHLNKCKECTKKDTQLNRRRNIDYYREYDRRRGPRMSPEDVARYRAENPEKYKAHNKVNNGLRDGKISKPRFCEHCSNETLLHAHHYDYNKPYDVVWLCAACHKQAHAKEEPWKT